MEKKYTKAINSIITPSEYLLTLIKLINEGKINNKGTLYIKKTIGVDLNIEFNPLLTAPHLRSSHLKPEYKFVKDNVYILTRAAINNRIIKRFISFNL